MSEAVVAGGAAAEAAERRVTGSDCAGGGRGCSDCQSD